MDAINQTKELLGEPKDRIKLYDFVLAETNQLLADTSTEHFPVQGQWSTEEFIDRIKKYEAVSKDMRSILELIAFWGEPINRHSLILPFSQLTVRLDSVAGNTAWIGLRWYPIFILIYSAGIAALAAEKFKNLKVLFDLRLTKQPHSSEHEILLTSMINGFSDLSEMFKYFPGLERHYTPRSDYFLILLRPEFEDILGLSEDFDYFFDRFEVLLALEHANLHSRERFGSIWGPLGRFAWMYHRGDNTDPYHRFISEAEIEGEEWPILKAGFFGGSLERFREIANEYSNSLARLGWH